MTGKVSRDRRASEGTPGRADPLVDLAATQASDPAQVPRQAPGVHTPGRVRGAVGSRTPKLRRSFGPPGPVRVQAWAAPPAAPRRGRLRWPGAGAGPGGAPNPIRP